VRCSINGSEESQAGLMPHSGMHVITVNYPSYRSVSPGRHVVDLGAVLGGSLDARISNRIELTLEGMWRMRFYV
jgi:hypothetical protein